MQLLFFTCAESSVVDSRTNRLSIFHVMEEMEAASFPAPLGQLTCIMMLSKTRRERQNVLFHIRFNLNKQLLVDLPFEVNFQDKQRVRGLAEIRNLVISGPGKLQAVLNYKNKDLGEWTVQVKQIGEVKLAQEASAIAAAGGPVQIAARSPTKKARKKKSK